MMMMMMKSNSGTCPALICSNVASAPSVPPLICFCFLCQSQALAHLKGTKHAKKLKALDAPKSTLEGSGVSEDATTAEVTKSITSSQVPDCPEGAGLFFSFPEFPLLPPLVAVLL